jgi:hypothetical protein
MADYRWLMSHDATLRVLGDLCAIHGSHRPIPVRTVKHHIIPQEYGGPTVEQNLLLVCDTGHYNIHAAIDAMLASHPIPKVTRRELAYAMQGYHGIIASGRDLKDAAPRPDGLDVRWGSDWQNIATTCPGLDEYLWGLAAAIWDQGAREAGKINPFWRDDPGV